MISRWKCLFPSSAALYAVIMTDMWKTTLYDLCQLACTHAERNLDGFSNLALDALPVMDPECVTLRIPGSIIPYQW